MKRLIGLLICSLLTLALAAGSSTSEEPSASYESAQALVDAQDFEAAVTELKNLVANDPDNPDSHNLLAYSLRNLGEFETALSHYESALELDPTHVGALEYLGELYLKLGDVEMAQAQLETLATVETCAGECEEYGMLAEAIEAYTTTGEVGW